MTGIGAGLWAVGLVVDGFLAPLTVGAVVPRSTLVIEICAASISVVIFLYVRFHASPPQAKCDLGLWYMLLNAAAIALLNTWVRTPSPDTMGHLSWTTIVILISSMVISTTPRRMLVAALAAAKAAGQTDELARS